MNPRFLKTLVIFSIGFGAYWLMMDLFGEEEHATGAAVDGSGEVVVGAPIPAGSIFGPRAQFEIVIYHRGGATSRGGRALVEHYLAAHGEDFRVLEELGDEMPAVVVVEASTTDYPLPEPELLPFMAGGLNEEERARLLDSSAATALAFAVPGGARGLSNVRTAYEIAAEVTAATKGFPFDVASGEIFTLASWKEDRLSAWGQGWPALPNHFMIHSYNDGPFHRAVTIGLQKFGLPDIVVHGIAPSHLRSMGSVINLTAQTLAERGDLTKAGRLEVDIGGVKNEDLRAHLLSDLEDEAGKSAELEVAIGTPQEGDADNRLLEIVFPGPADSLQARHDVLITRLFGSSDEITHSQHDEEVLAASARAKRTILTELKPKVIAGLPPGERLLVKAPFAIPEGGDEWMWIDVVSWEGEQVKGILANDPFYIPDLKSGAQVSAAEGTLFDYILKLPDGAERGNETGKIIMKRQEAEEAN